MKFFLIYILFYLSFSYYQKKHYKHSLFVELSPINNFRFKQSPLIVSNDNINLNEDIGPGPVFKKGWLKYLILTQNDSRSFNQFNKNQAFYEQATHKNYQNIAKDDYGVLEVPDSFHFFFYLTSDSLYIVSARKNSIAKTLKIVNFKTDNLKINEYLSGVEDQGNYQEGYCFKLRVKNCGFSEFLILCSDSLAEKKDWMKRISILQNRCQNPNPHIINEAVIESNIKSSNQYESNYTENIAYLPQSKIDGRWIILHDWSTCTLACGGGTQTLHRFCIPPSDGGAPCVGNSIVNR